MPTSSNHLARHVASITCLIVCAWCHDATAQMKWQTDYHNYFKEEYQVIYGVKHGEYIRSAGRINPYIHIYGHYTKNMRNGYWYFFYPAFDNPIFERGHYINDKKEGSWLEYYPPNGPQAHPADSTRTAIVVSRDLPGVRLLRYDTLNQRLMSVGMFFEDRKIGTWDYYSPSGQLIHRFDYETNTLVVDNLPDSLHRQCTFLGGPRRLMNLLLAAQADGDVEPFGLGQQAVVIIGAPNEHITYAIANEPTHRRFEHYVLSLFEHLPNDWLIDEDEPRMIKVRVTTVRDADANKIGVSFISEGKADGVW